MQGNRSKWTMKFLMDKINNNMLQIREKEPHLQSALTKCLIQNLTLLLLVIQLMREELGDKLKGIKERK